MAILGIDEVGRGPWAGPLVIGAVVLPDERPAWVADLKDSKQLTPKKREELNELILAEAAATGLGWVWRYEIDEIGLGAALRLATRRAVEQMRKQFPGTKITEVIIDGTQNFLEGTGFEKITSTLVRGDDLIKEISAASIIAKVARDRYMRELAEKYPEYGFESHKGYGTKQHIAALEKWGATKEHRLSLRPLRRVLGILPEADREEGLDGKAGRKKDTTAIGNRAEQVVADDLESSGHEIVARNYRNQLCEIDVIAAKEGKLYFVEVKYRRDDQRGGGIEAVTATKKRQMEFAAKVFLANRPQFQQFDPLLAVAEVSGEDFALTNFVVLDE